MHSTAAYSSGVVTDADGIPYTSYNTWNVGIGFTWKVFTLDLRYSDTNLSKGDCNAFTSDPTATGISDADGDQSVRPRLELVRRDLHRQAVSRPNTAAA